MTRSLFIVSLPRSLSTLMFRVARDALGLRAPLWARNGEILNHDLFATSKWPKIMDEGHKFVTEQNDPQRFAAVLQFLDTATRPTDWIYKDVVQPFLLADWSDLRQHAVLKIQRSLAEVAFAMLARGWYFPMNALEPDHPMLRAPGCVLGRSYVWSILARRALRTRTHARLTAALCRDAVLAGLVRANDALRRIDAETVAYADLVVDQDTLRDALAKLYPGLDIGDVRYIDAAFERQRAAVQQRAGEARFRQVERRLREIQNTAPASL